MILAAITVAHACAALEKEAAARKRTEMALHRQIGMESLERLNALLGLEPVSRGQPDRSAPTLNCRNCGAPSHRHEPACTYCGSEKL